MSEVYLLDETLRPDCSHEFQLLEDVSVVLNEDEQGVKNLGS
ncbi:MAG: hypothetical protein ABI646_07705 [Acidobacteriota bacterium]